LTTIHAEKLLGIGKYAEAADIVGKTTIYLSYRPS